MKYLTILLTILFTSESFAQEHVHCGTSEKMQEQLSLDANYAAAKASLEEFTARWIAENQDPNPSREVYTIPVVVHVVYNNNSENISDDQVESQIAVLNEDFRALNDDITGVPSVWTDRIADVEIEFRLADYDPNGNPTNGITRTETDVTSWGGSDDVKRTSAGGKDGWPNDEYLNIWVCDIGAGLLGYAYQPGIQAWRDGVVIGYRYFGLDSQSSNYDLGRTTTHEIGHYFNLDHLWGPGADNQNCNADDAVSDTPRQQEPNFGCSTTFPHETCGDSPVTSDMFNNFMDYGNDECLFFFTEGQKARMLAALNGPRSGLKDSPGLSGVGINEIELNYDLNIYPNPASNEINITLDKDAGLSSDVIIYDLSGREVTSATKLNLGRGTTTISVAELTAGTYVLEVRTAEGVAARKVNIFK